MNETIDTIPTDTATKSHSTTRRRLALAGLAIVAVEVFVFRNQIQELFTPAPSPAETALAYFKRENSKQPLQDLLYCETRGGYPLTLTKDQMLGVAADWKVALTKFETSYHFDRSTECYPRPKPKSLDQ